MKLVAFALITALVHGPVSPLLPTAYEATLLYYVRLYPAWVLALVGTLAACVAEVVNYRVVDWAAARPALAGLRERRAVRWSVALFRRAPFWATALIIFSPLPDTAVRLLAPLGSYPIDRFVLATAVGRFPRLLLIAGVGAIVTVPAWLLLAVGGALLAGALARRLALRRRRPAVSRPPCFPVVT
ncbi:MAG: VTT domain-containing protein [Gemmatimonadales bacterium]